MPTDLERLPQRASHQFGRHEFPDPDAIRRLLETARSNIEPVMHQASMPDFKEAQKIGRVAGDFPAVVAVRSEMESGQDVMGATSKCRFDFRSD